MNLLRKFAFAGALFFIIILFTHSSEPYVIHIRHLSVEDGFASREVFCGIQDKKGFVWFGTRSGLNRYDGRNFLLYTENNSALRDDRIIRIAEDDAGFIWIMHGQLDRYNSTDTQIDILNPFSGLIGPLNKTLDSVPFHEANVMAFARNDKNEFIIHINSGEIYKWSHAAGFVKQQKTWLFNSRNCTQLMNGQAELFTHDTYIVEDSTHTSDTSIIYPMAKSGEVYPSLVFSMKTKTYKIADLSESGALRSPSVVNMSYTLPDVSINAVSVLYDAKNHSSLVHIANRSVSLCKDNQYYELMSGADMAKYPAFTPYSHFCDREGNFWLCTNTGVYIIHSERNRFTNYFTSNEVSVHNYEGTQARAIYADTSGVYANIWDRMIVVKNDRREEFWMGQICYPLLIRNNTLWTGGYRLKRLDLETKTSEFYPIGSQPNAAWSIFPVNDSVLIYGLEKGIILFNIRSGTDKEFGNPMGFPSPRFTYRIIRDSKGKILAASEAGIYTLSESGDLISYYGPETDRADHQYFFRDIYDIYEDRNGYYWLATNGNGIFRWDGDIDVQHYTTADGLSSNLIYCILQDNNGYLWLSSDYGLMRFDPQSETVKTFTTRDGLTHNEFNRISAFKGPDGTLYFGGLNGIVAFNPDDFASDTSGFDAPMQIVSYRQFKSDTNQLVDMMNSFNATGSIIMDPGDRFFTLEFMLLDFEESQHHYAYKIEGIDADWIYTSENSIRFSDLPYGEYTLRIKGQNGAGSWSANELAIPVAVLKPFYREYWFVSSSAILSALVFFGFIRWRTYALRREKIKLEEIVRDRTEELTQSLEEKEVLLREIHHRVKNNLQIISSLLELQSAGIEDEMARAVLADSQNRVQSIGLIHHKLYQNDNLGAIEFSGFVSELFRQVSGVYRVKNINVEIEIDRTFLDIDTAIPAGLIINELMVNSFKYAFNDSENGTIYISLEPQIKDTFELVYRDSGPGIPNDVDIGKSKSLGLRLVSRLSKQIGGVVEYVPGSNHRFIITFKTKQPAKAN